MPWTAANFRKHNKGLSGAKAGQAARVANAILRETLAGSCRAVFYQSHKVLYGSDAISETDSFPAGARGQTFPGTCVYSWPGLGSWRGD